ncbi:MAG TPA: alpha-amylase family glycosyl hydrolase [Bacteroidota bacterium]|nr:alpha-amylase family glycosyl hydrolase [Bacteroidota bacterium]
MVTSLKDLAVVQAVANARAQAASQSTRTVVVNGQTRTIPVPFPSPVDWRDVWIYFIFLDRFNNPAVLPNSAWDQRCNFRQGGTFKGVEAQLDYLKTLGCGAIWISPVLKNSKPDWEYNYHGYGAQDFLNVDEAFASDGTRVTAEIELLELVEQIHARGMFVILDIVINHTGRVFDYVVNGQAQSSLADSNVMNAPLGQEPPVQWLNGLGYPRTDWTNVIPPGTNLSADDAIYPDELRNDLFFRRRGSKLTDDPQGSFVQGDFGTMRQMVVEYDATVPGQEAVRRAFGKNPVLSLLIQAYSYVIARYDFDGFRIDTVKYVHPRMVEMFGNAIREFSLGIGKKNFFTFGEVYDNEANIAAFVGRNGSDTDSYGIDAALDFPLFYKLPAVAKGIAPVETLRQVFEDRKAEEKELLSSHGEAGRFFVSFLDNHDQHERFKHPLSDERQIALGLAVMFSVQGIPSVYYGTEQGLDGTKDGNGNPDLTANESTREALWGKMPTAFDADAELYQNIQNLSQCRMQYPALRFGRLYFREVSGNGVDFGHSSGQGGIVAFSRILSDAEVVTVANTDTKQAFKGFVLLDPDLNRQTRRLEVRFSNYGKTGGDDVAWIPNGNIYVNGNYAWSGEIAAIYVELDPMEVQILA